MKGNTEPPIAGYPLERVGHLCGGETDAGNGRDEIPRVRIREAMPPASTELGPPADRKCRTASSLAGAVAGVGAQFNLDRSSAAGRRLLEVTSATTVNPKSGLGLLPDGTGL